MNSPKVGYKCTTIARKSKIGYNKGTTAFIIDAGPTSDIERSSKQPFNRGKADSRAI